MPYDLDPRIAWKQWLKASDQWFQRVRTFCREQTPEPLQAQVSWLALAEALQAQRAAEQAWNEAKNALLAQPPPFPEQCRGMTCGATTRKGTPCQRRDLFRSGRCALHGGKSTGPKSSEGKRRAASNGLRPKRKRTP